LDNVARWTVTFAAGRLSTSAPPLGWLANPAALGFATLSLAGYAALRLLRGGTAIVVAAIAITYPYVLVTLLSFIAPERAPVLTAGAAYALGESRLAFLKLEGAVERSTYASLAGLAAPGQFLPELDSALRTIAELIPERDAMVVYPGEDPVFFALSRRPRYPV